LWEPEIHAVQGPVDAGARLSTRDTVWNGTPLGWAEYYVAQQSRGEQGKQYAEIATYLRAKAARDA
jgi:peptide-methionine (S)-S-oxide reductase